MITQEQIREEILNSFKEKTKSWNPNIPDVYYYRQTVFSNQTRHFLKDDYIEVLCEVIKEISSKYSQEFKIVDFRYCGKNKEIEFKIHSKEWGNDLYQLTKEEE